MGPRKGQRGPKADSGIENAGQIFLRQTISYLSKDVTSNFFLVFLVLCSNMLGTLPLEVLGLLFAHLDVYDLAMLRATSRALRDAVDFHTDTVSINSSVEAALHVIEGMPRSPNIERVVRAAVNNETDFVELLNAVAFAEIPLSNETLSRLVWDVTTCPFPISYNDELDSWVLDYLIGAGVDTEHFVKALGYLWIHTQGFADEWCGTGRELALWKLFERQLWDHVLAMQEREEELISHIPCVSGYDLAMQGLSDVYVYSEVDDLVLDEMLPLYFERLYYNEDEWEETLECLLQELRDKYQIEENDERFVRLCRKARSFL